MFPLFIARLQDRARFLCRCGKHRETSRCFLKYRDVRFFGKIAKFRQQGKIAMLLKNRRCFPLVKTLILYCCKLKPALENFITVIKNQSKTPSNSHYIHSHTLRHLPRTHRHFKTTQTSLPRCPLLQVCLLLCSRSTILK